MSGLDRLLDPVTVAIVGLSADPEKHGGRVLGHLRKLGFGGEIWGVNPGLPRVEGVEMFGSMRHLPAPPDLVVCAVPARVASQVAAEAVDAGGLVVFAGGFGEAGADGSALEVELREGAVAAGVRVLGPNSGGIIRPERGLAASFLTCLDRPAGEIRSGPVGLVTQSGGTGSYVHNLAAASGRGLAVSISTGNEVDIKVGEAIDAVSRLDEVQVVLALIETVRDGWKFIEAVRESLGRAKPVVACRIGTGRRGKTLMTTHTGAMALPERMLEGVLDSLGVVVAETPGEAYEVAEMIASAGIPSGDRAELVTHSGGIAIHLADLAERWGVSLPDPSPELRSRLDQFLDLGVANNPLDMGGIIGGPGRFAEVVETVASSGEYDLILAVSTAHPPAHTGERVEGLLSAPARGCPPARAERPAQASAASAPRGVPILHLWMAGDQGADGLRRLRQSGVPVTEEPRAAIRALAGLGRLAVLGTESPPEPVALPFEEWGLPLVEGELASDSEGALTVADRLGYPVVVKVSSPGLAHKTEVGGVALDLSGPEAVVEAFDRVTDAARSAGLTVNGARVERYRPGVELIVGGLRDPVFGPMVSVGLGGILTELIQDVVFALAPVGEMDARRMIDQLRGRPLLDGFRGGSPADIDELARIVSLMSRGLVGSGLTEVELNPLIWDGGHWVAVDWLIV